MKKDTLMTFPCDFPLKIIGKNTPSFLTDMKAILRMYYPLTPESAITHQLSTQGNYQSITAILYVLDQANLDALYHDLSRHPDIHMVL